jgi:acyl-coenzyme A thioesterase PaaI-like protein
MPEAPYIALDAAARQSRGGTHHGALVDTVRALIDAVSASDAPEEVTRAAMVHISRATAALQPHGASRYDSPAGNRADLPGEGHPALAPTVVDHWSTSQARGRVVFTRAHDGGGGTVHGGFLPLIYDDILGRLAARAAPRSRTAFLHIDYRAVTPVGVELSIEAKIDRIEGRKIFVSGTIRNGDVLCNESVGLFVVLRPGQP